MRRLDRDHEYPSPPLAGCPLDPGTELGETNHQGATAASNPNAGWTEAMPSAGGHYFANVIAGDTDGYNAWAIEDDTSDGGQFHGYSRNVDAVTNAQAFEQGWVMTTRAKLVSGTQMSTYLLAYLGTNTFRYLPYIYFSGDGDIVVREYGQPEAVLPQAQFDPEAYHLYELVYDPAVTNEAECTSRGFAANCAAKLYVDGTDQGWYYPYTFPGATDSTAALQWGSGSSGGQAHLRYNLVHWALLDDCSRQDYFYRELTPEDGQVVYLKMDEESGNVLTDSSGNENHGTTNGAVADGRFCRGQAFVESGSQGISIPSPADHPTLEFGTGSFSVMGWAKFDDYTYPRTSFVAKNGHGCYFGDGRDGWVPGWEIGHGFREGGSDVCIRDSDNNKARSALQYNAGSRPADLLGSWAHYAFVFDRESHRVFVYINGVQQTDTLDISAVTGSVNNDQPFTIGTLYGWKTEGQLDEYRMYNRAVDSAQIAEIAAIVPEMADGCPVFDPTPGYAACPAFVSDGMTFFVNSYDANSWTDGMTWIDVSGTSAPAVGRIPGLFGSACDCFAGSGECTPDCPDSMLDLTGGEGGSTGMTVYNNIPSMPGMTVTSTQPVYNNRNYYYIPYLFDGGWQVNAHTTYYLAAVALRIRSPSTSVGRLP